MKSELRAGAIDLGAVLYSAQHPQLRFSKLVGSEFFSADSLMISKASIGASTIIIPEILFMHQEIKE